MSAVVLPRHRKYKKNFAKTQIYERLFLLLLKKTRLLELYHSEIVFIVDDDAIGFELAGLACGFP